MLSAASSTTRVNLGPFSTSLRGGALAVGGLAIATRKLTPQILSAAEAVVTLTGGAGAAAGVGVLALAQGAGVAKLGLSDLSDALGGSEEAAKRLTPEVRDLFNVLSDRKKELQGTAQQAMLPGLSSGAEKAMRNFRVFNRVTRDTGRTLGGLADEAGGMVGSKGWGRDMGTLGAANVDIIDSLGGAGLHLADALRHVAVEAAPLTTWLADQAEDGARFVEVWAQSARASGDMARFFKDARTELTLLGSATGHGTRGIINLFGNQDVDGTRTLRNLDQIMARFERWTTSPAARADIGQALVDEFVDLGGRAAGAMATGMANAAPTAAGMFIDAFMEADAWGKLLVGGWLAKKLGAFKLLGGAMGRGGAGGALGMTGRGSSMANPVWVQIVGGGPMGPGGNPGSKAGGLLNKAGILGALAAVGMGASEATNLANKALGIDVPGPNIGLNPLQIPAAAERIAGLFGHDEPKQHRLTPTGHEEKLAANFPIQVSVQVEGREVARADANANARRRARQAGPLAGP